MALLSFLFPLPFFLKHNCSILRGVVKGVVDDAHKRMTPSMNHHGPGPILQPHLCQKGGKIGYNWLDKYH